MEILYIIPARGGSKGIPRKNIKLLHGKPLIEYTIDAARELTTDDNICVSTDDDEIIKIVEDYGLKVPFKRPVSLATDTAGTYEVLLHALSYYEQQGKMYDVVVLLQTTTPFRTSFHIKEALSLYSSNIDMVVTVKEVSANPYYNCFEEDKAGFLFLSKKGGNYVRRQDAPKAWEYNGGVYVVNPCSLKKNPLYEFTRVVKYEMDARSSLDLDSPLDWDFAELIINKYGM